MHGFDVNIPMPSNTFQSDPELARRAAAGDRAAFEKIVRRYSRPLADYAAGKTQTVQDAEDVVQETFMRAFVNLKSFDAQYSMKNRLFTISYRLIISGYRKKRPIPLDASAFLSIAEKTDDTPQIDWLWELAGEMGTDVYTVLWLRYKQSMEISEIARVMKKTTIGVRVLLHRSRRRLAERIETLAANDTGGQWSHRCGVLIERTEL